MTSSTLTYYNENAQNFAESTLTVDMSPLYQKFLPLIAKSGHILDAGCGSGRDALHFKNQGFTVSAFDASAELAKFASEQLQQEVEVQTFETIQTEQTFDGIWCCASLLHVPKHALLMVFQKLQAMLKPDGVLYVSFKYGDEERMHNGRQFTDMNEESLVTLIESTTGLILQNMWQTVAQRPGRTEEKWLNALVTSKKEQG